MLLDLLSAGKERADQHRFDIDLLASRLHAAASWLGTEALTAPLPLGLFGASTGAAAALRVAADSGTGIAAGTALAQVLAPTLLIVGGKDDAVLALNRAALTALECEKGLEVVPGATHLFEEPGTAGSCGTSTRRVGSAHAVIRGGEIVEHDIGASDTRRRDRRARHRSR